MGHKPASRYPLALGVPGGVNYLSPPIINPPIELTHLVYTRGTDNVVKAYLNGILVDQRSLKQMVAWCQ